MPRISDHQPSDDARYPSVGVRGLTAPGRRRIAVGIGGLVAAPVLLLTACGNAKHLQNIDTRPEPNASTEGVRSVYPQPPVDPNRPPIVPLRSGGESPGAGNP